MCYIHWYHPATDGEEMWEWEWNQPMPDAAVDDPVTPRQLAKWVAEYQKDGWVPKIS